MGSRVTTIGNSSFRMEHRIVSRALREVVAEADSAMVTVDYSTGKSQRVPDDVRQAIAQLENRAARICQPSSRLTSEVSR